VLTGELYLDAETIRARLGELGAEITRDYQGKNLLMVSILKGAVFFLADLARAVDLPLEIDLLAISSYNQEHEEAGTKAIRFLKDLDRPLSGKDVLVVEHIIDTGLTLHYILRSLAMRKPAVARPSAPFSTARIEDWSTSRCGTEGSPCRTTSSWGTASASVRLSATSRT